MPSATGTLIRAFWQVCNFKLAPQGIPYSPTLLCVTTAANTLLSISIYYRLKPGVGESVIHTLLELVVLIGLTITILYSFARSHRVVQTLTALMGTGALIGIFALILLVAFQTLPVPAGVGTLLMWAIFFWNLSVVANILCHALDAHLVVGFLIAIGYMFVLSQFRVFIEQVLGSAPF